MRDVSPTSHGSTGFFFFAVVFNAASSFVFMCVLDCRSECVWEEESNFLYGSSQPSAHSAAEWVTVYPPPQLRVLMCECVHVDEAQI